MSAIDFKPQFADLVGRGTKTQTTRKVRKRPIKVGEKLTFYTGQRTDKCRKIGQGICTHVWGILIDDKKELYLQMQFKWSIKKQENKEMIACSDGFSSYKEMVEWFDNQYGLPFNGVIIKWRNI